MTLFMNIYMKAMKNKLFNTTTKAHHTPVILLIIGALILNNSAHAQENNGSTSKLPVTMNLSPIVSNGARTMKVVLTRKENKKTIHIDDLRSPLNLYLGEVREFDAASGTGWMCKGFANNEGEAILNFPAWFKQVADTLHQYKFIVTLDSDSKYEDAQEEITIADARIDLEYFGKDSIKTAAGQISGWKEKEYKPAAGAELKLGVKRTFNFLPFTEAGATTDEDGKISGELPLDLPGEPNNTIILVARVEDDATYGTVEVTKTVPWTILPKPNPVRGRTLWSPGGNAPWILVISSISIILIIWGTILYLVSLLFKIKRLGKVS